MDHIPLLRICFSLGFQSISLSRFLSYLTAPIFLVSFHGSPSFSWPLNIDLPRTQTSVLSSSFILYSFWWSHPDMCFCKQSIHPWPTFISLVQTSSLNSRLIYPAVCPISPNSRCPKLNSRDAPQTWSACSLSYHNGWQLSSFSGSGQKTVILDSCFLLTCTSDLVGINSTNRIHSESNHFSLPSWLPS